ncbi:Alpha/Beta hydrolase protein [Aspergillus egyptiacus]|nr:Alpha/Beta hydrolase protein [Aspergillus egyptiacus]
MGVKTPKPEPDAARYIPAGSEVNPFRKVRLHYYYPRSFDPSSVQRLPPSPVLITVNNGLFTLNSHGHDDAFCRYLANNTNHIIIDASYALAPEHPFPTALEDLSAVVRYVLGNSAFNHRAVSIGGFGTGATLAASLAVNYFPAGTFKNLIAFYPWLNFSVAYERKRPFVRGEPKLGGLDFLAPKIMRFFQSCYLVNGTQLAALDAGEGDTASGAPFVTILDDPRLSPDKADLKRFPRRCLFVTAEYDCLARDAERLAARLRRVNNTGEGLRREVAVHRVWGCGHGFDKDLEVGSERAMVTEDVYEAVAAFLNRG